MFEELRRLILHGSASLETRPFGQVFVFTLLGGLKIRNLQITRVKPHKKMLTNFLLPQSYGERQMFLALTSVFSGRAKMSNKEYDCETSISLYLHPIVVYSDNL
jgi:hypothetical protein